MLMDSKIGVCYYRAPGADHHEEYEVAVGISDVATLWGRYQRVTELGKLLSFHNSRTQFGLHANDWGLSAKPPSIFAQRFEESLCIYFGCPKALDENEMVRCCMNPSRPANYYCGHEDPRLAQFATPSHSPSIHGVAGEGGHVATSLLA